MKVWLLLFLILQGFADTAKPPGIYPITPDIADRMQRGGSWHKGCPVPLSKLRLLRIRYHDFNNTTRIGSLIVHEAVSQEVMEIFKGLYTVGYAIERMQLVSDFGADDETSMRVNNTSAFNCRYIAGTKKFSKHSYGKAIDINPRLNPCITKTSVAPANAHPYIDRKRRVPGMLHSDDPAVKIFKKAGWQWGGEWHSLKDYQHFEK